jgi:hypothetical protein
LYSNFSKIKIFKFQTVLNLELTIGSGAPSLNDHKFDRHPPGAPWPTFHKSNETKLFLISIFKGLESLETFRSGLLGLSLITRKTGASDQFQDQFQYQEDSY